MNVRVRTLFTLIFVMGLALAAAGRVTAAAPAAPVWIDSLAIDGTTLIIKGLNFGSAAPTVSIDDTNIVVSRNSDTEIVGVTQPLGPGMHLLKLVRDAGEGGTAESTLQIQ